MSADICWAEGCYRSRNSQLAPVDPDDPLGLCEQHRIEICGTHN